jgi:AbrB family looped-hinge helix DNA binding protein
MMNDNVTVKVSNRYQISLPSIARKQLNIQAGDRLLVDIQEGLIVLCPQPKDYVDYMAGLHQEVWQGLNTTTYLEQERTAWQPSSSDLPTIN